MHDLFLRWFQLNSVVLLEKIYTGAPNEKLLAKYLNVISGFLESFRAYLCKLIQVDLFCVFNRKFNAQQKFRKRNPIRQIS